MSERSVRMDEIGPEAVVEVADPESGMQAVLVVDSTRLGPAGGGIRMLADVTVEEVAALARAMTYKYGILGLPRGGCKVGLWGDPDMGPDERKPVMEALGRAIAPYLVSRRVTVGPDMGLRVDDLVEIYAAAGAQYPRSGLYNKLVEGQPFEFHITGHGVVVAARTAFEVMGLEFAGARVAVEGFGHVGVGASRYAVRHGARLVAVSTIHGGIYNEAGLDFERLLELREEHGDRCLQAYPDAQPIPSPEIHQLPVDLLVPGARPYVITEENVDRVQARVISSGANIPMAEAIERRLFERGVLPVPDFIANSGGVISSWVDYLGGNVEQAFRANDHLITEVTREVLQEALRRRAVPREVAAEKVKARIMDARGKPPKSYEQVREEICRRLGVFGNDPSVAA